MLSRDVSVWAWLHIQHFSSTRKYISVFPWYFQENVWKVLIWNFWNSTLKERFWWTILITLCRSCHRRCSVRKLVLRNSQNRKIHMITPVPGSLFKKVAGWRNFSKFLRTPFLQNTCGRLLLFMVTFFQEPAFMIGFTKIPTWYLQLIGVNRLFFC